ncbi:putative FAD-dependent oxygenase [Xylariales sp. PMI_506]|nr:putative FAD-dependent oxygenase [Xylariales sp. PMI_506]
MVRFSNIVVQFVAVSVSFIDSTSAHLNITQELGPLLSPEAAIVFPGSPEFLIATDRDNELNPPTFSVVVEVATESDVQETVRYANKVGIPFLATTGLHGGSSALGNLHHGINIRMRKMKSASISPDGGSATFGGGTLVVEAKDALWAAGKQTSTGACECVSLVGPLLGGGYGYLQGFYGLVTDILISARVVLGNGDIISVSANENSDLFWALRGAGHNFGIVTEVTIQIYDIPPTGWSYIQYIFTHDKVEDIFTLLNLWTVNGTQDMPVQFINKNIYVRIPSVDPDNAVIIVNLFYQGIDVVPTEYTAPLLALGPAVTVSNATNYLGLTAIDGTTTENGICLQHGAVNMMFPISYEAYNIAAQRAAFNAFNTFTADNAFLNSTVLFESYSMQAVKAVSDEETAFPYRADSILVTPVVSYAVNTTLNDHAIAFGEGIRQVLHKGNGGSELHAYVNYAHGDETLQEMYGYEPWRIARLKSLKHKYDPGNRFRFFGPI